MIDTIFNELHIVAHSLRFKDVIYLSGVSTLANKILQKQRINILLATIDTRLARWKDILNVRYKLLAVCYTPHEKHRFNNLIDDTKKRLLKLQANKFYLLELQKLQKLHSS